MIMEIFPAVLYFKLSYISDYTKTHSIDRIYFNIGLVIYIGNFLDYAVAIFCLGILYE